LTEADFHFCAYPPVLYGCGVNPTDSLRFAGGCPQLGDSITFALDNPLGTQPPGTLARLGWALFPDPSFPCGTLLNNLGMAGGGAPGELLLSVLPPLLPLLKAPDWYAPQVPVTFTLPIVDAAELVGAHLYFQGMFLDLTLGPVPVALTEAYDVMIGL